MAKKKIEYERKCNRDGTTWYAPEELHKKPRVPWLGSATRGGQIAAQGTLLVAYLEASRCPTCGSQDYTETKIKLGK